LAATERLKHKKVITALFQKPQVITFSDFRCCWSIIPQTTSPVLFGVSVSKSKFKKSVDRNTVKRRLREQYRISKHNLYKVLEENNTSIAVMMIYQGKVLPLSIDIAAAFPIIYEKLIKKINAYFHK
jgi:ribonuclease P protein component